MEKPAENSFLKTPANISKDFSDSCFLIASFLDPLFKYEFITHSHLNTETQKQLKSKILGLLIAELYVSGSTARATNATTSNSNDITSYQQEHIEDRMLNPSRNGNESPMKTEMY